MAFTERLRAVPPTVRNVNVKCTGLGLEAADEDTATIRTGVMYGGFIRVVFLVKSLYMDGDIAFVGIDIVDVDSAESRTDIQTVVDRGDRRRKRRHGGRHGRTFIFHFVHTEKRNLTRLRITETLQCYRMIVT